MKAVCNGTPFTVLPHMGFKPSWEAGENDHVDVSEINHRLGKKCKLA